MYVAPNTQSKRFPFPVDVNHLYELCPLSLQPLLCLTGCRVQGTGYTVQATWYRVQGTGHRAQGTGYRILGTGYSTGYRILSVQGTYMVYGTGYTVQGIRYRVQGTGHVSITGPLVVSTCVESWPSKGASPCCASPCLAVPHPHAPCHAVVLSCLLYAYA